MSKTIGIDLGTSFSCVSVMEGGQTHVIENAEGRRTTPSIFAITKDGEEKVGEAAKRQAVTNPLNTIYEIKRLMGKSYEYAVKEGLVEEMPYKIVDNKGRAAVEINGKVYTPEEISARILQKMKKTAEDYLGQKVDKAVITVPAYFNDAERKSTQIAGEIAGLEVLRIINEPTAAALSYGSSDKDKNVLVFDFGGGTHDVSILEIADSVFEVKSTSGDVNLGGANIDDAIIDFLAEEFKSVHNVDLRKDPMALQRLKEAAEKAKIELSSSLSTEVNLPYIIPIDNIPQHLTYTISRAKFDTLIESFIKRTIEPCKTALKDAKMSVSDIDEVILVGGSTRIPAIQTAVEQFFNKKVSKTVNPDEAVSCGATIQGSVISGDNNDILLLDVIPLSIGIETMGGIFTKLVEANTTIPTSKSEIFSTAQDSQLSVEIVVAQGERPMFKDNKLLGRFHVNDIPPAPRGVPQIEVTVDIDANSVMTVTAVDKGTGKQQSITINDSSSLSDEEIKRMKAEAEANREADEKLKETVDKVNMADSLIFQTEKMIKENEGKISDSIKTSIEEQIANLKEAKEAKDVTRIDSVIEKMNEVSQQMYADIQKNTQQQTGTESGQPVNEETNSTSESAEDVEFEEVK